MQAAFASGLLAHGARSEAIQCDVHRLCYRASSSPAAPTATSRRESCLRSTFLGTSQSSIGRSLTFQTSRRFLPAAGLQPLTRAEQGANNATNPGQPQAIDIPGTSTPSSEIPESKFGSTATLDRVDDYSIETVMQELRAIQATGPKLIAMLGTRHLSLMHQQIVEMLAYALVLTGNHIFTSGAGGANAAVIRGALRADRKDLLTVILPQSLSKQPPESQEQLKQVEQMFENKMNDNLPLPEASRLCNEEIISRAQQFICFAFHDSRVLLSAADKARNEGRIVTLLFAD